MRFQQNGRSLTPRGGATTSTPPRSQDVSGCQRCVSECLNLLQFCHRGVTDMSRAVTEMSPIGHKLDTCHEMSRRDVAACHTEISVAAAGGLSPPPEAGGGLHGGVVGARCRVTGLASRCRVWCDGARLALPCDGALQIVIHTHRHAPSSSCALTCNGTRSHVTARDRTGSHGIAKYRAHIPCYCRT